MESKEATVDLSRYTVLFFSLKKIHSLPDIKLNSLAWRLQYSVFRALGKVCDSFVSAFLEDWTISKYERNDE